MISTPAHLATLGGIPEPTCGRRQPITRENQSLSSNALWRLHRSMRRRGWPWRSSSRPTARRSVSVRSLGLSRDAASLAWSARRLMAAGKKEDALKLYGRAISVAVPDESSRSRVPRFSEDPGVPRYLLPGEEQVRDIVARAGLPECVDVCRMVASAP